MQQSREEDRGGGAGAGTEVRNRLDELEEQQRKASWLRPANWPRLFAKLAMGKLGAVLGTTLLMKPLCSAACAPEMADSWDAVPGLAPCGRGFAVEYCGLL